MVSAICHWFNLASWSDRYICEWQYDTDNRISFSGILCWCSSEGSQVKIGSSWKKRVSSRCNSCTAVSWVCIRGLPTFNKARFNMATWSQGYSLKSNSGMIKIKITENQWQIAETIYTLQEEPIFTCDPSEEHQQRMPLNDILLSVSYCHSQMYLSDQLARLHPDLTMPIFSGKFCY
jgi:hypothetical protein